MCRTTARVRTSTSERLWVCVPSLLTARYAPSGLGAAPKASPHALTLRAPPAVFDAILSANVTLGSPPESRICMARIH